MRDEFDVVVIGGGHAGLEAAAAAARAGVRTLLVTPDLGRIGQMSCNPAIGGVAKGVVAREVDALGGVMGRATDASRIQFRMLNRSKGPAVWGPRAQCDRALYPIAARRVLEEHDGVTTYQDMVEDVVVDAGRAVGVRTRGGRTFGARTVVVTTGTFLRGRIHVGGEAGVEAGRAGEAASVGLAEGLEGLGLEMARFKTGTPPRIDGRSVDFGRVARQDGDEEDYRFAAYTRESVPEQRPCWITWAGTKLQQVVADNLHRSALYGGEIGGQGPRYCPSIEDKIVRFPDAERHQVFLEPEGLDTTELYVNGLSTSLPVDVQIDFLRSVPGLEEAVMTRPGYAIEYDYFPPHQLAHTLEVKGVPDLFFAGQINGTTGYEEAAGQGIVAGINAALKVRGEEPFVLERDQAYIGVLIDDLVTRGVDEPYRLFTSRAEFRLLLRQDNAPRRLGTLARERGLLVSAQVAALDARLAEERRVHVWFEETTMEAAQASAVLEAAGYGPVEQGVRASDLLKRPRVSALALLRAGGVADADGVRIDGAGGAGPSVRGRGSERDEAPTGRGDGETQRFLALSGGALAAEALAAVEVEVKYEGYVARERARASRLRAQAEVAIPEELAYEGLVTVSHEAREKLARVRPGTLAQAARVPGVSPADLQNLLLEIRRFRAAHRHAAAD